MPLNRSLQLKQHQLVWLGAIIAVGLIVGIAAGLGWGLGAAAIVLAVSEVIERVKRRATT